MFNGFHLLSKGNEPVSRPFHATIRASSSSPAWRADVLVHQEAIAIASVDEVQQICFAAYRDVGRRVLQVLLVLPFALLPTGK